MKKWLALGLVSLMLVITACGNNNAPTNNASNNNTPTATNSGGNTPAAEETPNTEGLQPEEGAELVVWDSKNQREVLEQLVEQFKAKYNVSVKIEEVETPDQIGRLTIDGPAGTGADVVSFAHDGLGQAVSAGLILPNDHFEEATRATNAEAAVNAVTYDGKLFGYPRSVETYALFYNKDILQTPPTSFEEIVEFAKTFNTDSKYAIMWETNNFYFNYPFIATNGGYIFGNNGQDAKDIGINNDGAVKAMNLYQDLKEILPVKSGDITGDLIQTKFANGEIAMTITGPWKVGDFRNAGINFGVAKIPTMNGDEAVSFSGVKAWYVNAYSKYPQAARLLANFLGQKDSQLLDYQVTGIIPSNTEATADAKFTADEIASGFASQFVNSHAMPSIPEMGKVWDPAAAALAEIWDNGVDPKAALDNAVQQISDAINGATK